MKLSIAGIIAAALLSGCASTPATPAAAPVVVNPQAPAAASVERPERPQSYATKYRNGVRTALLAASACGAWAELRGLVAHENPLDVGGYECIVTGLPGDACNETNATEYTDGTCGVWFNWSEM